MNKKQKTIDPKTKADASTKVDSKTKFRIKGLITKVLPGSEYAVEIEVNNAKYPLIGYISGKMRRHYIRLVAGDKVEVEISPYDKTRCRIVYRLNANNVSNVVVNKDATK